MVREKKLKRAMLKRYVAEDKKRESLYQRGMGQDKKVCDFFCNFVRSMTLNRRHYTLSANVMLANTLVVFALVFALVSFFMPDVQTMTTYTHLAPHSPAVQPLVNISSYKFILLADDRLPALRDALKTFCINCSMKGTILLSPEGINLMLCGTQEAITQFWEMLRAYPEFADMQPKQSESLFPAFKRMKVLIKKEIITMRRPEIKPLEQTAPRVAPKELQQWLNSKRDVLLLDTRNEFEIAYGTFENAINPHIPHFQMFADAVETLEKTVPADTHVKDRTIVTFCTGGIRCEKASAYMMELGYKNVFQLDGGILKYFEETGGAHWNGSCFVFDERVAVTPDLQPIGENMPTNKEAVSSKK